MLTPVNVYLLVQKGIISSLGARTPRLAQASINVQSEGLRKEDRSFIESFRKRSSKPFIVQAASWLATHSESFGKEMRIAEWRSRPIFERVEDMIGDL